MIETALILVTLGMAQTSGVISPGPSFLIVARTSIAESRRAGAMTSLGLGFGAVFWASAALFGLTSLFDVAPWSYLAVKLAGGCYLLYLAWQLWRHAREPLPELRHAPSRHGAAVLRGLLTQLTNPKTAIFFGSIYVTLLPSHPSFTMITLVLSLVFVIEISWYLIVAFVLSNARLRAGYARIKTWIDRATGTFLGLLGTKLIADH